MPIVVKFTDTNLLTIVDDNYWIGVPAIGQLVNVCYPEGIYEATIMYMTKDPTNAEERCKELIVVENNNLLETMRKQGPNAVRKNTIDVPQASTTAGIKQEIFYETSVPDGFGGSRDFVDGNVNAVNNELDEPIIGNDLPNFDKSLSKQPTINNANYNIIMNGTPCTASIPTLVGTTMVPSLVARQIVLVPSNSGSSLPVLCVSGAQQPSSTFTLTPAVSRISGDEDRLIVERVQDILRCAQTEKLDVDEQHNTTQYLSIRELNELKNQCNHSIIIFAKHLATRLFGVENSTSSNGAKSIAADRVKWLRATINNMFPVRTKHDEFKRWEQIIRALQEIGLSAELFMSSLNGEGSHLSTEQPWQSVCVDTIKTGVTNSEPFFESANVTSTNAILESYWSDLETTTQTGNRNNHSGNNAVMNELSTTSDGNYGSLSMALCQQPQEQEILPKVEGTQVMLMQYFSDANKNDQLKEDDVKIENKSRARQRERRAQETPEERARRLERQRERNRQRFEMETVEDRQSRLARLSVKAQLRRSEETEEQRSKRLNRCREYARQRRQRESYDEWQQRLSRVRQNQARWWQNLPEDAKKQRWQAFSRKWREKHISKMNDSDSQSFNYESP